MKKSDFHVVYIITKLELGGAQKVCLSLIKDLKEEGVPVSLITGAQGPLMSKAQQFDSVYFLETFKREIGLSSILLEIKNFFAVRKILKKLKKKHGTIIVHTHSTKAGLIGRWAAFFAGIKNRVHTVHGYGFHDYQAWHTWLAIYLLELVTSFITTHFVCVSHKDRNTGIRLFPWFGKKSSVIRAAVDWDKFTGARLCNSTPIIGTIACFKPQKNLFDLLKAFELVYEKAPIKPELHIIGDGQLRKDIETWIEKHNLSHAITLLGWQEDVATFLKSWNIFALSSLWEGLPCALVEARLCRLPVVAYNVGGISEIIHNGANGFLIEPGDYHTLAKKILYLIENKANYEKMMLYKDKLRAFHHLDMSKNHYTLYKMLAHNIQ